MCPGVGNKTVGGKKVNNFLSFTTQVPDSSPLLQGGCVKQGPVAVVRGVDAHPPRHSGTCAALPLPRARVMLVRLDGDHVAVQIQDTPGCIQVQEDCVQVLDSLSRCVKWAEGFLLVYSITDYSSYQSVRPLYQHIRKVHPDARTPIIIVGNKADLLHARQVQAKEGLQLANELGSLFLEISTSDDSQGVCDVFQYLCKEVSKLQHVGSTDRRRSSIIPRPKSPNMQDLKRRFKQALSSKVK
uniref:small monomeric GTPase n=1 Tax=Bubo bubo TaxID=30461 RepID=A0A8C0IAN7_BUBBB